MTRFERRHGPHHGMCHGWAGAGGARRRWRRAAAAMLVLSCLGAAAAAAEAPGPASGPASGEGSGRGRRPKPADPIAAIEGNVDAWSVSRGDAGCYLMSPHRQNSSRLALGRHPTLGQGLFVVGFGLAVLGPDGGEAVTIRADRRSFDKLATMPANKLLFIPLDDAEFEAGLQALRATGALWLVVRGTWIAHGGQAVQAAVTEFSKTCADAAATTGAPPDAADAAAARPAP